MSRKVKVMTDTHQRRRTRKEAAQYVRDKHGAPCTDKTLTKLASVGGGPVYSLFGNRALYTEEDLDSWVKSKLSAPRRSTGEAA